MGRQLPIRSLFDGASRCWSTTGDGRFSPMQRFAGGAWGRPLLSRAQTTEVFQVSYISYTAAISL